MLNSNIFQIICSKIEKPSIIYKVIESFPGTRMVGRTDENYFYEIEEAYQFVRKGYILRLENNLDYYKCCMPYHSPRNYTMTKVLADKEKIETICADKQMNNLEKVEKIYDEILVDKVKDGFRIHTDWRITFCIERVEIH